MIQKVKLFIGDLVSGLIVGLVKVFKIEILTLAHRNLGIGKSHSFEASGEKWFISKFLPSQLQSQSGVLIDVGANKGKYSELLAAHLPGKSIYSFEPSPRTYEACKNYLSNFKSIKVVNFGVGEKESNLRLYTLKNNLTSVNASTDLTVLKAIATEDEITSFDIKIIALDDFVKQNSITEIDLLKIDTEGFELEVLAGCKKLLEERRINIIQFEFNEVSAVRRIFLKDFYDVLGSQFSFYRLDTSRLIPLKEYAPINEIFQFQNIIAIRNNR